MYARSIALILAAASLASAAPARRDTPQIVCQDVDASSAAQLRLQSNSDPAGDFYRPAFNGERDSQGRQNLVTLNPDGSPSEGQDFVFRSCYSSYLGYDEKHSGFNIKYGFLVPADAPNHCVTVSEVDGTNARLVSAKCTYDDNDSLYGMFWQLSPHGLPMFPITHVNGTASGGYYGFSVGSSEHKKVQVDWSEDASTTGYNLAFQQPSAA